MFAPKQLLKLAPKSILYKGPYTASIVKVSDTALVIKTPMANGRIIPLPVGTILKVYPIDTVGVNSFPSEIISRTFNPQLTLTITLPGTISRVGRNISRRTTKVIAITSGKGGVGKTTSAINLSIAFGKLGFKVCLIDVDLGTANVDFLLNLTAPYNLSHLLSGEKELEEIIIKGPKNLRIIAGSSGMESVANLREWQFSRLINAFNLLEQSNDLIVFDTGAGISHNVTSFLAAADEIILITTPDPHALLDAYSLVKVLCSYRSSLALKLIINKVEAETDINKIKINLFNACRSFLNQPIDYLGHIPDSRLLAKSVREQTPLLTYYPNDITTKSIMTIARKIAGIQGNLCKEPSNNKGFIYNLQKLFSFTNN